MAALSSASVFSLSSSLSLLSPSRSATVATSPSPSPSPLKIESAHHVNFKSTKKHTKCRPKKHSLSDKKRGGTKDYGPWNPTPIIFEFLAEGGEESQEALATGGENRVYQHDQLAAKLTREAIAAQLKKA